MLFLCISRNTKEVCPYALSCRSRSSSSCDVAALDEEIAQIWGRLRVPHAANPLDKQIAATALMYGLTVVTRNVPHYAPTGVAVLNPFT